MFLNKEQKEEYGMRTYTRLAIPQREAPTAFSAGSVSAEESSVPLQARTTGMRPPAGYAIAFLADDRFLPLAVAPTATAEAEQETLAFTLRPCCRHTDPVPPAEGDAPASGPIICSRYDEARWWCERRAETACLLHQASVAALRSECYPDRNVWYREEIERLVREAGYGWPLGEEAGSQEQQGVEQGPCCIVEAQDADPPRLLAWLDMTPVGDKGDGCALPNVQVEATNLDELWERLYEAVSGSIPHRRAGTQESRG